MTPPSRISPLALVGAALVLAAGAATATAATAAAPAPVPDPEGPLVIAVESPQSGDQASNGLDQLRGVQLAVRQANAHGGVLGRPVRIQRADDRGDADRAKAVAQGVIAAGTGFVIGPYNSSVGIINLPLYRGNRVLPMWNTSRDDTRGAGATVQPMNSQIAPIAERYVEAARLLAALHAAPWAAELPLPGGATHIVPPFDRPAMLVEVGLLLDWYVPHATGHPAPGGLRDAFAATWNALIDRLAQAEQSIVLRDYHSPNLIWRGERAGLDRLGLLDFQDAMIGPAAYDVASLAWDARVDVEPRLSAAVIEAYAGARGERFDRAGFEEALAIMSAQRNSKILGIFVRLDRRDGKPQYLRHLPRIRAYLRAAFAHPALAALSALYAEHGLLDEATP